MRISKTFTFDAAHRLIDTRLTDRENLEAFGKCCRVHGHTYTLEVAVESNELRRGMVMNFVDLAKVVHDEILERWDHVFLNAVPPFNAADGLLPTAENMVVFVADALSAALVNLNQQQGRGKYNAIRLAEVTIWETPTSKASLQLS